MVLVFSTIMDINACFYDGSVSYAKGNAWEIKSPFFQPVWDVAHGFISDGYLFPFEGIIPWQTVFDCVKKIGFDGPLTIETKIKPEPFEKLKKIVK